MAMQDLERGNIRNEISDMLMSGAMGQFKGATLATRGLSGAGREKMLRGLTSNYGDLGSLAGSLGLSSIAELNQIAGEGIGSLGDNFGGMSDVIRAAKAQRSGLVQSTGQYMGMAGNLSQLGGGTDSLEEIMKNAVADGMESSKSIAQIVTAVQQSASASAGMGTSTVGGIASIMNRAMDVTSVPKDMLAGTAAQSMARIDNIMKSKSFDLANITEMQDLRKSFGGAEMWELIGLSDLSAGDLETLNKGGKDATNLIKNYGLDKVLMKDGKINQSAIKSLNRINKDNVFNKQSNMGLLDFDKAAKIQELRDKGMKEIDIANDPEVGAYYRATTKSDGSLANTQANIMDFGVEGKGGRGTSTGKYTTIGNKAIGAGSIAEGRSLESGANQIDAKGGIGAVVDVLTSIATNLKPENFMNAVKKADESISNIGNVNDFKTGVTEFGTAVKDFQNIINQLGAKQFGATGGAYSGMARPGPYAPNVRFDVNGNPIFPTKK
jgi:hypothetical protein